MIRLFVVIALLASLVTTGCQEVDPGSAAGTFARLGPCIDRADRRCVFELLDRDSRWSLATIQRTLASMRALVERSYPKAVRAGAYGSWSGEARAADAAEVFAGFCARKGCLEEIAASFGAPARTTRSGDDEVRIETTRGVVFALARHDGRWGIRRFSEELQAEKLRLLDRLEQVEQNARAYDEQRIAGGAPPATGGGEQ